MAKFNSARWLRRYGKCQSLNEIIKGACTTKNGDVLKIASKVKKQIAKFSNLSFVNITKDKGALTKWKEQLKEILDARSKTGG